MKTHRLKTWLPQYIDIRRGAKTFEVRVNDRDFKEGDKVMLLPWDQQREVYAPDLPSIVADVGAVLRGPAFGIPEGHCVFSLLNACTSEGLIARRKTQSGGLG